jgi:hypothetical protein
MLRQISFGWYIVETCQRPSQKGFAQMGQTGQQSQNVNDNMQITFSVPLAVVAIILCIPLIFKETAIDQSK